jgi:hypothetical protein
MSSYDFEVWQGVRALHSMRGVELERPSEVWNRLCRLPSCFRAPGCRFVVKDEQGGLAILVGAQTAWEDAHAA